ncbi:dihydroneopterin aldolase [Bradyrhizobium sp. STM 3566]|uniref:dihydroneopterin aldolase n=1 Tax=Bradyrhizobium sp. STM 3566 TaxID=578928 RepID=UPI00388E4218
MINRRTLRSALKAMLGHRFDYTIFIRGLIVHARHGLPLHETQFGQRFVVDIELHADHLDAVRSDDLNDTVDYSHVVPLVAKSFALSTHSALGQVSTAVAEELLKTYARLDAVTVTVHTPHAPILAIFDEVGARITLRRRP